MEGAALTKALSWTCCRSREKPRWRGWGHREFQRRGGHLGCRSLSVPWGSPGLLRPHPTAQSLRAPRSLAMLSPWGFSPQGGGGAQLSPPVPASQLPFHHHGSSAGVRQPSPTPQGLVPWPDHQDSRRLRAVTPSPCPSLHRGLAPARHGGLMAGHCHLLAGAAGKPQTSPPCTTSPSHVSVARREAEALDHCGLGQQTGTRAVSWSHWRAHCTAGEPRLSCGP